MFVYKNIDGVNKHKSVVHYSHTLNTASLAVTSSTIVSGSINESHWNSLNVLFFTSGSPTLTNVINPPSGSDQFDLPHSNFAFNTQYVNKFHGYPSSSLFSVSEYYYGDTVKKGSFKLTNKTYTDNNNNNPIILDDGYGNLYSSNAHHSQSTNHPSHSDNYVGNIFYDWGIAVITETGSWSGSVNYPDLVQDWEMELDSTTTNYSDEYTVTVQPREFNYSLNYTLKCFPSGSTYDSGSFLGEATHMCSEFTGSEFQPYVTMIHLYNVNDMIEPVITAKLPKPVRISDSIANTFVIKLDK